MTRRKNKSADRDDESTVDLRVPISDWDCAWEPEILRDALCLASNYVIGDEFDHFENRQRRFQLLNQAQRTLLPVALLEEEMWTGGFQGFYWADESDFAAEAVHGLEKIGAVEYAKLLRKSMEIFPNSNVPRDRMDRWMALVQNDEYRLDFAKKAIAKERFGKYQIGVNRNDLTDPCLNAILDDLRSQWSRLALADDKSLHLPKFMDSFFVAHRSEFLR